MNKFLKIATIATWVAAVSACTRVETGNVGVRLDMNKQIQGMEIQPGQWAQTLIGEVLTFPTKDIAISLENKSPMTSENTALADFDMTVVYAISPSAVSELYSTKSKSFHTIEADGDMLLMHNYMSTLVNNAAYKVVRNYTNLQAADNRQKIEEEIRAVVTEQLKTEKLDSALTLNVVQVRNILPNAAILQSATDLVSSQNALKVKENEIRIAEAEARRMQMLTANAGQSIAYMNAQSLSMIAEGVKNGKVNSIIIPHNFAGIIQMK
jgi:hypothetical protein